MANFAELKAARDRRKAQRSFSGSQKSTGDNTRADIHDRNNDAERKLVDSSDATKITSDILEQPSLDFGQSKNTEIEVDLGIYRSFPPGLDVQSTETQGRGLWSRKKWHTGEIILVEVRQTAALSTHLLATHCSTCFGEAGDVPLKRCPTCHLIHYCDLECQSRDWPLHKRECAALQKWTASAPASSSEFSESEGQERVIPSDAIRTLGRLLWRRQKNGFGSVWAKQLSAMQSHRARLSSNEKSSQLHTHMAHALVRYLGLESMNELSSYGIDSITSLVDLISRFTTNAFTVTSPTLTPIGVSISPTIALFNHSCEPNAVLVFPRAPHNAKMNEPMMVVIAIRDILPDEEIVISYIDSTLSKHERQEALQETYYFTCHCLLCDKPRDGLYVDPREGLYCPKKCGGFCWLPSEEDSLARCTKCGAVVKDTDGLLDAIRIGYEALNKANRVQFSDPEKAIQLTTNLIPILSSAGLLPSAQPLLALSRLHTTLLISNYRSPFDTDTVELNSPQIQEQRQTNQENVSTLSEAQSQLDDAIRSATRTSNGLNQILPYGHPIRALALTELGKLLSVDEPDPEHLTDESNLESPGLSVPSSLPPLFGAVPYPPSGPQRLRLAYETLVRARGELIVGFGGGKNEGGRVGMEVRKTLVEVEKELGVWKEGIRSAMMDLPKTTGK